MKLQRSTWIYALGIILAGYVFYQNAWVTDDAYITFRSVEQLHAGNGPVWNPHERVQVFTHPLWYWLLATARTVSADMFMNAIVLSSLCLMLTLAVFWRIFKQPYAWFLAVLLFLSSKALIDYVSSGLENPLSYLLLSLFFLAVVEKKPVGVFASLGLLILCRHDILVITLPAAAWVFVGAIKDRGWKKASGTALLCMLPFILWSLFALFYYGSPFPNSAYAKLSTGHPYYPTSADVGRIYEGLFYFSVSMFFDPMILVLAIFACVTISTCDDKDRPLYLAVLGGIVLHMLYLFKTGGDYMAGRFLTLPLLLCILLTVKWARGMRRYAAVAIPAILLSIALPTSPINSSPGYRHRTPALGWVSDERSTYWSSLALHQHLLKPPEEHLLQEQRTKRWYLEALKFAEDEATLTIYGNVGVFGYYAGLEKTIIDYRGITDPFLARIPAKRGTVVGHYDRDIPEGYWLARQTGHNAVEDPELAQLYSDVSLATQADLFEKGRLAAIIRLNLRR